MVLNTTGVDLKLGTGGYDFVVWNLAAREHEAMSGDHVMKLRYTPAQADVRAVELVGEEAGRLSGMPVLCGSLHSQLLPAVVGIRWRRPDARIAYVMTDGGALELPFSRTVRRLRDRKWLEGTVTAGHAIGGDLEAVNLYSALLAACHRLGADIAIVAMGPGVVGTATRFGTTAIELGLSINAAAALDGRPVAMVRVSEADPRLRHQGLSHHVVTSLQSVALARADVPVPLGQEQLGSTLTKHRVVAVQAEGFLDQLGSAVSEGFEATHMGRTPSDDPAFFLFAGAAGIHAASLL